MASAALLLLATLQAASPAPGAVPAATVAAKPVVVPGAIASQELKRDTRGRPMIDVSLNGRGPFPMIVDTAAGTSLIGAALARELNAPRSPGTIEVRGATGATQSALYAIDRYATRLFDVRDAELVELSNTGATDARGIIGMEFVENRKLVFDRAAARLTLATSAPPPAGFAAVPGFITPSGFVEIPVLLNGVRVHALVDTGAGVTIANAAARKLMGLALDDPRLHDTGDLIRGSSVAGNRVLHASVDRLGIGPATLRDVRIYFTGGDDDTAPPHLILGSDLLNAFPAFAVDFGRAELQIPGPPAR